MSVKKAVKKAGKKAKPTLAEQMAAKTTASMLAWRQKRERVHKGLTNANVEPADG